MPALPSGTILLWSGSIATIPGGFLLCDGTLDTPDLRDRFVRGAGGAFAPGTVGGSSTHTHDFTGDGHSHDLPAGAIIAAGTDFNSITTSAPAVGTTFPGSTLPPYYALAYIMKT